MLMELVIKTWFWVNHISAVKDRQNKDDLTWEDSVLLRLMGEFKEVLQQA